MNGWRHIRFQADPPNETWQADFTHHRLANGTDIEILTWLDDHSRYALSVTAHRPVTGAVVVTTFRAATAKHGIPHSTLTDNGLVFTTRFSNRGRTSRNGLEAELVKLRVRQKNCRPNHHPDTEFRVRNDRIQSGRVSLRINGQMHHIGLARTLDGTRFIMLIDHLDVRIIHAATGEILRTLTIDPNRRNHGTGRPTGGPKDPEKSNGPDPQRGSGPSSMSRDITMERTTRNRTRIISLEVAASQFRQWRRDLRRRAVTRRYVDVDAAQWIRCVPLRPAGIGYSGHVVGTDREALSSANRCALGPAHDMGGIARS